jgi:hypothetical protein
MKEQAAAKAEERKGSEDPKDWLSKKNWAAAPTQCWWCKTPRETCDRYGCVCGDINFTTSPC